MSCRQSYMLKIVSYKHINLKKNEKMQFTIQNFTVLNRITSMLNTQISRYCNVNRTNKAFNKLRVTNRPYIYYIVFTCVPVKVIWPCWPISTGIFFNKLEFLVVFILTDEIIIPQEGNTKFCHQSLIISFTYLPKISYETIFVE